MLDMAHKDILPAMSAYSKELADAALEKKKLSADIDTTYETETVKALGNLLGSTYSNVKKLEADLYAAKSMASNEELADFYKDTILADMGALRASADEMETMASSEKWPYPSYGDLLFGVR